ncbi:MAG TPA: PEGA domain-containing protein, partial [Polyangiales bacterium]|nr:PEGA domain-containing protein [Polyangiales bacterium]
WISKQTCLAAWVCLFGLFTGSAAADGKPAAPPAPDKRAPAKPLPPLGAGSVFAFLPSAGTHNTQKTTKGSAKPDDAVKAISEHLKAHGFKVLPANQVRSQLASHALEGCKDPTTCDPALALATLRADAVISTAIWQRPSAPAQLVVHVRRQLGYGQAEVDVRSATGKELKAAAVKALQAALEDSQQTHEISVLIESLPMGATVHVDQTLTGSTPARFALLPGSHLVSVEAPGFVTRAQYLELPERGMSETKLSLKLNKADADGDHGDQDDKDADKGVAAKPKPAVALAPAAPPEQKVEPVPTRPQPTPRDRPSTTNYVLAGVLFAIAAPLIANAVYGLATKGACVGEVDVNSRCSDRVTLGPYFYLSAGLGGLALLGGTTFLIVQPLETTDYAVGGAQLQVTQRF